jgi:hypothetical protein
MIANDNDEAVMESCAEVIGYAYEENTPLTECRAGLRACLALEPHSHATGNV